MWRHIGPAFRMMVAFTILTGLVYPGVMTGLCQIFFHHQADGSLLVRDGRVVGSSLLGQNFSGAEYFHPRPSAAGKKGYDPMDSRGPNLGPTSRILFHRVAAAVARFREENPAYHGPIPADMVTASASGLDPDISPASALAQATRVAQARHVSRRQIIRLIGRFTQKRQLGFLGEPRVNVLEMNLALDRALPQRGRESVAQRHRAKRLDSRRPAKYNFLR